TEQRWRDSGSADTEELRKAMQHYRAVFDRVVSPSSTTDAAYPAESGTRTDDTVATDPARERS
ncbi:MAG TPA: hypothetical protein VHW92_01670, partial [Mycobacteriales bacterium]|nr:hypothetical protein [Mycobacteriales bacterium]